MKPTATDIMLAIEAIEIGDWIDPGGFPNIFWTCDLFTPDGKRVMDGVAETASQAVAMAWVNAHAPDALTEGYVPPGEVPFVVPDGWWFELTPPGDTDDNANGDPSRWWK
jgi:hypothetical protein